MKERMQNLRTTTQKIQDTWLTLSLNEKNELAVKYLNLVRGLTTNQIGEAAGGILDEFTAKDLIKTLDSR